jgi:hypothetical protein
MRKKHAQIALSLLMFLSIVLFSCGGGKKEAAAAAETIVEAVESGDRTSLENDIDTQDEKGWTALMLAVIGADTEEVASLIEEGADLLIENNNNRVCT